MTNQILISIPYNEFQISQRELIKEVFQELQKVHPPQQKENTEEFGTRVEVAKKLRVSLPTLAEFTKTGKVKGYRIGGRVLYKWSEVNESLQEIISSKYQRA